MDIQFTIGDGNLNNTTQPPYGNVGFVGNGNVVGTTFLLNTPYKVYGRKAFSDLGITQANNPTIYNFIDRFYKGTVDDGIELIIMGVADTVVLSDMVDSSNTYLQQIMDASGGKINLFAAAQEIDSSYSFTQANGVDPVLTTAIAAAQTSAATFQSNDTPVLIVLPAQGLDQTATDLVDLRQNTDKYIIVLNQFNDDTKNADIGMFSGWFSVTPLKDSIARVARGSIPELTEAYYWDGTLVSDSIALAKSIGEKGFVIPIKYNRRGNFFYDNQYVANLQTSDLNDIYRIRVVNAAQVVASTSLSSFIQETIPIQRGTQQATPSFIAYLNGKVNAALNTALLSPGHVSDILFAVDIQASDFINGIIAATIEIQPNGHTKSISVRITFTPFIAS